MVASKQATVTERRALLTDREREIVAGDADVEDSYRYQTISRIRARFDRLDDDLAALEEHGELAREFRKIVCAEETPAGERRESREEPPESNEGPDTAPNSGRRETASAPRDGRGSEAPGSDVAPDALEDVDFPAGREREACSAAVYAARDYLRDHGPATMREIVAEVMPDHPLGYDVDDALEKVEAGDRYRGAWWRSVVRPGLETLGGVKAPPKGRSDWKYTGEA